jgi:general secretion pathway protein G
VIEKKADSSGYPATLAVLVEGVPEKTKPDGGKIYFLRRIPKDPITGESWGLRSYASPADSPQEGKDVYDVYSRSDDVGLNRIPYKEW